MSHGTSFFISFKSVLTRLAELNCSIMHQCVILYLWCSSSLSPHSTALKFGAKHELQACKAPCVLIVLYILLICNASWYQASRAPGLLRDSKEEERRSHLSSVFPSSFCQLVAAAHYQSWRRQSAAWPSLRVAVTALPVCAPLLSSTISLNPGRHCQAAHALLTHMLSTALSPGRPFPGKPC